MHKNYLTIILILILNYSFANYRVVGYLPTYRFSNISQIDFSKLTHVMASFANPDKNGDWKIAASLNTLITTAHSKNCKVMASIGGGAESEIIQTMYIPNMAADKRSAFISKLMQFVRYNNLDGIDVDLESTLVQDKNYNGFVMELADSLKAMNKETSAALHMWNSHGITSAVYEKLDFINIMAYDNTGPWAPNSPGQHAPMSQFTQFFNNWKVSKKVPANKIVMGLPFYGYEFTGTSSVPAWTWCSIVSNYPNNLDDDQVTTNKGTLYFNGKKTIKAKVDYVKQNNGGGIMIWELGQDCFNSNSLFKLAYDDLVTTQKSPTTLKINLYPNPANNNIYFNINTPITKIKFFDVTGKELSPNPLSYNQFDISEFPNGVYFVSIISDKVKYSGKFIKK